MESLASIVLTVLVIILTAVCFYLFGLTSFYWKRRGVPSYGNVITGTFTETFKVKKSLGECLMDLYFQTKHEKYVGTFLFNQPILVINDPEIIKQVFLKEHSNFASHGQYYDIDGDPLSGHLFNLAGSDWKFMRTKLTPTFTSAKIKNMFGVVQECISTLDKAVDKERLLKNNVVEIREVLARVGTDIIASVAFGLEANSFEDKHAEFRRIGKDVLRPSVRKMLRMMVHSNFKLSKILRSTTTDLMTRQFFSETFAETVDYREKNNVSRNDFLDLMIRLKNENQQSGRNEYNGRNMNKNDILAQSFVFFLAGFETSSSTNGFTLLELAKHPDIQRKVQEECDRVMEECDGEVTFEAVQSMEYTDRVINETMRLYPALLSLSRASIKACQLPLTDLQLEKDTIIWIPLLGLHMDEEYFPNPHKFDPDRFTEKNKQNIKPFTYMPFGDGPRHCIGMRFALVQMKCIILKLMSKYNVEVANEADANVEFHPCTFITTTKRSFSLKITERNQNSVT